MILIELPASLNDSGLLSIEHSGNWKDSEQVIIIIKSQLSSNKYVSYNHIRAKTVSIF